MAENKVKDGNFISVQSFMVRDLQLKGNELLIYAIIYGFSQAENQVFSGSLQYLADWTNSTKQGVIRCLKSLLEKEYVQKNEKTLNGVKFCEYYATDLNTVLNKVEYPIKESLTGGIKESLPNNIDSDNTEDTIAKKKREKAPKENTHTLFDKLYPDYNFSETLVAKMREWITYKVERKEDYKEQGMKSLLTQIKKKCAEFGDNAICDLIEDCMANNWKGIIFDRLNQQSKNKPKNELKSYDTDDFFNAALQRSYSCLDTDKPQPKTAGNDETVRKKAEDLQKRLGNA